MRDTTDRSSETQRAVLMRRQRIDIGDVSRTGCRVGASPRLAVGTVGMLTVEIDGQRHVELFRVARSSATPGADQLYEAGLEFLPLPADMASLHSIAARLERSSSN